METKNSLKIFSELSLTDKILVRQSSRFFAKRITAPTEKESTFSQLTQKQQLDYFTSCAKLGIIPDLSKPCKVQVSGIFGMDFVTEFKRFISESSVEQIASLLLEQYTEGTDEAKCITLWDAMGKKQITASPKPAKETEETEESEAE